MTRIVASREHSISCGHRVMGHEGKCQNLHGHNYTITFVCEIVQGVGGELDNLGRVIDFGVIKSTVCKWLEENWDHRMLIYELDPWLEPLKDIDPTVTSVPFNPTAENIAKWLLYSLTRSCLPTGRVKCTEVWIHETDKCAARVSL